MLLFRKPFHAGLVDGSIRLTFRSWDKPHVRAGGRYRCHPIGVLEVDRIERVRVADITDEDARLAGLPDRAALLEFMNTDKDEVFRVELHHGGDGDRVAVALDDQLTKEDVATIREKLAKLGTWARKTLTLIEKNPRVAASKLAARVGRETAPFKADVVKLKKLGLTQSFEVGYELSPRGRAYLAATTSKRSR
jgi:hypothetical protein